MIESTDGLMGGIPSSNPKVTGSNPVRAPIDFGTFFLRNITYSQSVQEKIVKNPKIQWPVTFA